MKTGCPCIAGANRRSKRDASSAQPRPFALLRRKRRECPSRTGGAGRLFRHLCSDIADVRHLCSLRTPGPLRAARRLRPAIDAVKHRTLGGNGRREWARRAQKTMARHFCCRACIRRHDCQLCIDERFRVTCPVHPCGCDTHTRPAARTRARRQSHPCAPL